MYREIAKEIKKGIYKPLYVFFGTETFLMKELTQYMKERMLDPSILDFNFQQYDLRETPFSFVLEDAQTPPFFGDRKLLVANGAYFLTGNKEFHMSDEESEKMMDFIADPPPFTSLILQVETNKLDERKKIVKRLKKDNLLILFEPLKDQELIRWIYKKAQELCVKIDEPAVEELILRLGNSLNFIYNELKKMATYVEKEGIITKDVVSLMVSRTMEHDVFALIDRISQVKLEEALSIFYDLLKHNEEPIKMIALLARQFRIILQVKLLQEKGYSQNQMASLIKVHPYAIKLAGNFGRKFTSSALEEILNDLAELDYKMKSGQMDKILGLELFILSLKSPQK
ncbi:DNA polymerase III subunit delta [Microaerobacter geothermalis]|uniref:DNA polymerase III subunit delta n=1 Tax=Microaerobacter geothermalis TaxID=674972 RepID=UPI001F362C1B|nr:DNA polymerase III subunit delta [Microaerobacter geothermalis]MCF6092873.1 DNA polymerase III subunit delta [Microaerobacter geothermalis]